MRFRPTPRPHRTRRNSPQMSRSVFAWALVALQAASSATPVTLPLQPESLKFAVFGDFGDASQREFDTVAQLVKSHATFPFEIVPLTGDNLYGDERPQDFAKKFEGPFKPLL